MNENNSLFGLRGSMNRKNYLVNSILLFMITVTSTFLIASLIPFRMVGLAGILALVLFLATITVSYGLVLRRVCGILSENSNSKWYGIATFLSLYIPYFGPVIAILLFVLPHNLIKIPQTNRCKNS